MVTKLNTEIQEIKNKFLPQGYSFGREEIAPGLEFKYFCHLLSE